MEDILEVYQRDFAENEVLVCMDETSKQHIKETRTPAPTRPGDAAKYDYEYERNASATCSCCARRSRVGGMSR